MKWSLTAISPKGKTVVYRPSHAARVEIREMREKHAPGEATHEQLWQIATSKPTDFEPWGKRKRDGPPDCSCGCNFFHTLDGQAGADWGVCTNPKSPRVGLLTFEHMGCPEWIEDPRWAEIDEQEIRILKKDKRMQEKSKG